MNIRVLLQVASELDRETCDSYQIELVASDGVLSSAPLVCTLTVTDINDNAPQFAADAHLTLPVLPVLNKPLVLSFYSATDRDMGVNAQIEYKVEPVKGKEELFMMFYF